MSRQLSAILSTTLLFSIIAASATAIDIPMSTEPVQLSEKYTNTEKNYSINYPSNWTKADVPKLDIVLFAPPKKSGTNAYATMNIVSEKLGSGITLERFYSESAANLASALKEVEIEKTGNTQISGVLSKWILYTHVLQNIKFRVLQYFFVFDETVYLLTFSAAADEFDTYLPEFEEIALSFKILKPTASNNQQAIPQAGITK